MADDSRIIREVGPDGLEVLSNILDQFTGDQITFKEITYIPPFYDGFIFINRYGKNYKREYKKLDVRWFGATDDGSLDSLVAFDLAISVAIATNNACLEIGGGTFMFSGDLVIPPVNSNPADSGFTFKGDGSGVESCYLLFNNGGLVIECSSYKISGFTVKSTNGIGVTIKKFTYPDGGVDGFSVRGYLSDVRAENCLLDGFFIEDTWILSMSNCYARFNKRWGVNLNRGSDFDISSNGFVFDGGEIQGNGTGGTTGGGVHCGAGTNMRFSGCSIEGNYADGMVLDGRVVNLTLDNVYFEKNGILTTNVDIRHSAASPISDAPYNILINNSNHTPLAGGQERAIDLFDVKSCVIRNPTFNSSAANSYTEAPIRISESVAGISTGWIEGGALVYSGLTRMLDNVCRNFGKEEVLTFQGSYFEQTVDTSYFFHVPLYDDYATRILVDYSIRPNSTSTGDVSMTMSVRQYASGSTYSVDTLIISLATAASVSEKYILTGRKVFDSNGIGGSILELRRNGTAVEDTYANSVVLLVLKATIYKGWIR